MTNNSEAPHPYDPVEIDLRKPLLAAVLAWLWPGAGHLYQRRYGKGALLMVCILITYFFGLAIAEGHVVFVRLQQPHPHYSFLGQIGVGLPAMPAVVQKMFQDTGSGPLFGSQVMAPPRGEVSINQHDELASWHETLGFAFELGTLFTTVAGLLNILAIYDAYAGPVFTIPGAKHGASPPPSD